MKLKFKINQFQKMGELLNMLKTLSKHDERIVMITRPESITLTIPRESNKSYLWFDLNCYSFCSFYKMEGVVPDDPENDLIMFEIRANYLLACLQTIKSVIDYVEIKLGKRDFPFFTINMRLQSTADDKNKVDGIHEVPVIIIPRIGWDDHEIPYNTINFDAQCRCPRFPTLKRIIDTFKYAPVMKITLRRDSTLTLEANEETTRHSTILNPMKVTNYPKIEEKFNGRPVAAYVEVKKILHYLHSLNFQTEIKMSLMIEANRNVKFFFRFRDDILAHFILPAVFDENDEIEASDTE